MSHPFCPLCSSTAHHLYTHGQREFLQCSSCSSVFLHPKNYLTPEQEKAHYENHNNDPDDLGYQKFVSPITNSILTNHNSTESGLDFGSGTGSPILKVLSDNRYNIVQYDLYFHNDKKKLEQQYDYIAASEVAEHFKDPLAEFTLLRSLLKRKGKLYIMTGVFDGSTAFSAWPYKNDHTHVFLYHPKAFEWIKNHFGYKKVTITNKKLIVLEL